MTARPLAELPGVAELIERSRRIGRDETLVVHGGGNTSVKTEMEDHLGRVRRVLVIKASGADLRTLDASGLVALYLDDLVALRSRDAMSDEAMVDFLARCRADTGPRRPSIETLLHAFLPARHVDHVHADAICALTNHAGAMACVRDALGPDVAYLPYERPGFALSRAVAEHAGAAGVVLGHHGLVAWGDASTASFSRVDALVGKARAYVDARVHGRERPSAAASPDAGAREARLLSLRGSLSRAGRRVLHVDERGRAYADRADARAIADAGPATADHLLRMRANPITLGPGDDIADAIDAASARALSIWQGGSRDGEPPLRDVRPAVALVAGIGTVTSARDEREARVIGDVAARSHAVAASVIDAFGAAESLGDRDLYDLEYWPLELAKLGGASERELESRVIVVTGAASGIGRDTAVRLAELGAHVALADRDEGGAAATASRIAAAGGAAFAMRCDVTDTDDVDRVVGAAIRRWGGIDGIVSNAGVAVTGRIEALSLDDWSKSLAVNATSHFLLARRVLRALVAQGIGGSLVFVGSKNAFSPGASFGAYSVAKAAEVQLARILAIEGGPSGIRANVVSPDAVFAGSKLWDGGLREERAAAHHVAPEELEGFYAKRSLLGVPVRASDVAESVAFLLSDRSSRMTGCVLTVDGGVAAAFPR